VILDSYKEDLGNPKYAFKVFFLSVFFISKLFGIIG